jgi:hypothetical protein
MIKLKKIMEDIDEFELEDLQGKEAIIQYLQTHGKQPELISLGEDEYVMWDDNIVATDYPNVKSKNDWIYSMEGQRLISRLTDAWEEKFNARFWEHPEILYHATPTENVEAIKQEGLKLQHKSRGMANRHIRGAVFTSTEPDWITHSYGPSVITINTRLMKADGFMPTVGKEPNHIEADVTDFIGDKIGAWKAGHRDLANSQSEGTTDDTIIIYSAIPPKYLSFEYV